MPTAAEETAAETAAEDDRLASLASAKKARTEKKEKTAAALSEKKQKAVDQAAAEKKRIAAAEKEKEASDARRANNINAREHAKAKEVEEKGKKERDGKRKGAAEEDVSHATTPAGAEDEAASAMWHAEEVAAKEGDEVKENEDGETQPRDFTSEGPHTASEGENTNDEGGEDELTSVDAPENESGEEGGEENEEEKKEESGEAEADLKPKMVGDGQAWWKGGKNVTGMSAGWWGHERAGGVNGDEAVADRLIWKNEGTQNPITNAEAVELAQVTCPLVRTRTTYPPH